MKTGRPAPAREFLDADELVEDLYSQLRTLRTQHDELADAVHLDRREKAGALALLAAIYPAVLCATDTAEIGAHVLYLRTLCGQMSWFISERDLDLFPHVPHVFATDPRAEWDLHTSEERDRRMTALREQLTSGYPMGSGRR